MKASEICIGDWFKAIDYNSPFRITAIYDDVVQTQADYQSEIDGNWYSEAYIKDLVPIELTEKILKENGFVYREEEETCATNAFHHWQLDGHSFALNSTQYFRKEKKDDMPRFDVAGIAIHYVHQLQHLLRLAGVQKEIEL